jgi:hypothetical protein
MTFICSGYFHLFLTIVAAMLTANYVTFGVKTWLDEKTDYQLWLALGGGYVIAVVIIVLVWLWPIRHIVEKVCVG